MAYYHSSYSKRKKKRKPIVRILMAVVFLILVVTAGAAWYIYGVVFKPNVWTNDRDSVSVFIPTDAGFDEVTSLLYEKGLIVHRKNFEWWAGIKKYPELIKPGRYMLKDKMSNFELVNLLRSGNQIPVQVVFNNQRDIYQLAGRVSEQIEADSASIVAYLTDVKVLEKYNLKKETISCLFIPNTYEFYWNTNAEKFVNRMATEYDKFWNESRLMRAHAINLTVPEVITLASIVEKETNKNDEKPLIAAVYLNRLKAGWLLQADPTLLYAINDKNIRRVLNVHKEIDSPYNTYKNGGLPPGPICIPSISSIEAVLNPGDENYLYFCAKDDLSGYHVFAKTNAQHNRNAKKYREALDELKVFK
ncbi:MAG: endolytic transglycosylase MltG [Bacteroidales bacterium]|nr:endolytic transglycosylase MltG [Bacteroidales bacterium]